MCQAISPMGGLWYHNTNPQSKERNEGAAYCPVNSDGVFPKSALKHLVK
jgi:hypothetical protein